MADWTTPKTWSVDELVTAPAMNVHVRDNLGYLFLRPLASSVQVSGTAYAVTSTSWAAVDATNLKLTLRTASGRVMVGFSGTVVGSQGMTFGARVSIDNGARVEAWSDVVQISVGATMVPLLPLVVTGLSAAEHTFSLEMRVNTAGTTLTVYREAERPLRFWVLEV